MSNEKANQESKPSPMNPKAPQAAAAANLASAEAQRAEFEAWQSTRLLDACVGAETDKQKKMEVVEIIHFHRLALKEYRDAPERKRLASQATMRKLRRILPHVSEQKLQPLLNATVKQLTPSDFHPRTNVVPAEEPSHLN
jgi:hypothetical protein